jgi:cyanophycinase-like exopeptidase
VSAETRLPRILTIMGSGETTPTMARTHRAILDRLGERPVPAVLLDTPYGFQENAPDISDRALEYFRATVGAPFTLASFRSADADALVRQTAVVRIRDARYVFTGPGSPTYALRVWAGTEIPRLLAAKLETGGAVTMASAAALTLGRLTVPVYEIYKVGEAPRWLDGLDLLTPLGLPVAVVPHYDNAEGGNHDTRFCYLGERRLRMIEADMPEDVFILGVDGHTALILDLDDRSATVTGLGTVTVRKAGRSTVFPAGARLAIADLVAAAHGKARAGVAVAGSGARLEVAASAAAATSALAEMPSSRTLREEVADLERIFEASLDDCDVPAAVRAILSLEETIQAWAGDTEQSDALAVARSALRSAVVCLGELAADGTRDTAALIRPFVDGLLSERDRARAGRDWAAADAIRDRLVTAGIELHDTPEGTTWSLPVGGLVAEAPEAPAAEALPTESPVG